MATKMHWEVQRFESRSQHCLTKNILIVLFCIPTKALVVSIAIRQSSVVDGAKSVNTVKQTHVPD